MNTLWLLIGVIVGAGGLALWQGKGKFLKPIDWILLGLWLALALFAIAVITSFSVEPFLNSGRAAMISGFSFGGLAIITGVLLFRKIFSAH